MAQLLVDSMDVEFVIWEQFDGEDLIQKGGYEGFSRKVSDMMIMEARKLAIKEVYPTLQDGDRLGITYENGKVRVPESFHRPYQLLKQGEWRSIGVPEKMGGQGGPLLIHYAAEEYFNAANWSLMSYMSMNANAAKPRASMTWPRILSIPCWQGWSMRRQGPGGFPFSLFPNFW